MNNGPPKIFKEEDCGWYVPSSNKELTEYFDPGYYLTINEANRIFADWYTGQGFKTEICAMNSDGSPFYIGKDSNGHFKHDHRIIYRIEKLEEPKEACEHKRTSIEVGFRAPSGYPIQYIDVKNDHCPKCGKPLTSEAESDE